MSTSLNTNHTPQKSNIDTKKLPCLKGPVTFSKAHHFGALHLSFRGGWYLLIKNATSPSPLNVKVPEMQARLAQAQLQWTYMGCSSETRRDRWVFSEITTDSWEYGCDLAWGIIWIWFWIPPGEKKGSHLENPMDILQMISLIHIVSIHLQVESLEYRHIPSTISTFQYCVTIVYTSRRENVAYIQTHNVVQGRAHPGSLSPLPPRRAEDKCILSPNGHGFELEKGTGSVACNSVVDER